MGFEVNSVGFQEQGQEWPLNPQAGKPAPPGGADGFARLMPGCSPGSRFRRSSLFSRTRTRRTTRMMQKNIQAANFLDRHLPG